MRTQVVWTLTALAAVVTLNDQAIASTFNVGTATGLSTPSFRDAANSTYLGWDVFGAPGDTVINDTTPDVGSAAGSFVTTNGEDHQSGSLNYYSGSGTVAETVSFATSGVSGSGFTTVIAQARTLFGGWGATLSFGPIDGVLPSLVVQAPNANGIGQLFVKYEIPGTADIESFTISQAPGGDPTSFGLFVIDTVWSADGFAADTAVAVPEPTAAVLLAMLAAGVSARRRADPSTELGGAR
jgi:hypothetical protein